MVRAFADGAVGRRIDPSWWTHRAIARSSQCSATGVTGRLWVTYIKEPLLLIGKRVPYHMSDAIIP